MLAWTMLESTFGRFDDVWWWVCINCVEVEGCVFPVISFLGEVVFRNEPKRDCPRLKYNLQMIILLERIFFSLK